MVLYDDPMAPRVVLPDEAPDLTATEFHNDVAIRLFNVLRFLFDGTAVVLYDIFVRVDETAQVAPDLTIVHGAAPGKRRVYRIPPEPIPDVTVEVLSVVNNRAFGRRLLEQKRTLLGAIGVPLHLELDPDRGLLTTWRNVDGQLTAGPPASRYDGDELAGLRIELSPGEVRLWQPDGREFIDASTELARAKLATQQAAHVAEQAELTTQRAAHLAEQAELATQRAALLAEALRNAGIDPESV